MSTTSSQQSVGPFLSADLERQLSISLVGAMIFYLLLGIILCQLKNYLHIALTQRRDDIKNHLVVSFLTIVTISKSVFAGLDISRLVIENFGNPLAANGILNYDWLHLSGPISKTVAVAIVVEVFFTRRYYKLSRNKVVVGIIIFLIISYQILIAIAYVYASLGLKNADIWLSLGLALQLACNATISFATIYHFRQQKVDAFRQSTNLIDRLIQMALRSALPPTFMAGIALITTEVYGITDAVPFACAIIVSQTFVISLLYTLNAREGLGRILAGPPRNLSWVATNVEEEQGYHLGEERIPQVHSAPAADASYYQARQKRRSQYRSPYAINGNGVASHEENTAIEHGQETTFSNETPCSPSVENSLLDHDITVGYTASSLVRNEGDRDSLFPLTPLKEESEFHLDVLKHDDVHAHPL